MTTTIGSLAVSLSLNSDNFNGSMAKVDRNLRVLGSELKSVQAKGAEYGKSLEGLRSKKDILNRSLEAHALKLSETRKKYDELSTSENRNDAQVERQAKKVNDAQAAYNRLQKELGEVDSELKKQSSSWTHVSEKLTAVGPKIQSVGSGMSTFGKDLSMKVTAPIVGVGIASAKVAIDFEAQMDRVGAIAGATSGDMDKLTATALDLGAKTSKSASEVALGFEEMAAMGFNATEIIGAMPGVISAAEASGSDMAQTAEVMASTLNIFSLKAKDASKVADILATTANISAANLTDMQYALKYAGPPAAALGISLEETAASIGIMTNAGMKGEQAGTTLRGALLGLLDPSEENSKLMNKMGIAITDNNGNFVGLSKLIKNLTDSMEGQTETQKAATLASLVGKEAVSGMLSLMKAGPAQIDKMTRSLENSGGASAETAAIMKDNLKGTLDELGGTFETAAITIGGVLTPTIKKASEFVQDLVEDFQDLSPETQKNILAMAGIAAAIGPVLVVSGALISSVGTITTAIGGLSVGALALTGPIGLLGVGIAGATVASVALYRHLDQKGLPQIDLFGEKVSESTVDAVEGFVKLNDEATIQLNQLAWGGMEVTQEMADSIVGKFDAMGQQVIAGMQEDHATQLAQLATFFETSGSMTEQQEQGVLSSLDELNAEQIAKYQEGQTRIAEILNNASNEKRDLTYEEKATINRLQAEMVEEGIKTLSDGEIEFKTIMERMKLQSEEITAEQAIQTINKARETKDGVVSEAEKLYEDTIAQIIRLRDEAGVITSSQATAMIREAQKQKDEVVSEADKMYQGVLDVATEKGGEHLTELEIQLGKQLSVWDEWSIGVTYKTASTYAKTVVEVRKMAVDALVWTAKFKNDAIKDFASFSVGVGSALRAVPGVFETMKTESIKKLSAFTVSAYNIGEDIVQGLINGIRSKTVDVAVEAFNIGTSALKSLSKALERKSPARKTHAIGVDFDKGLINGMEAYAGNVVKTASSTGKRMVEAALKTISSGTKATNAEIASINKKAHEEEKKIEARAGQDIYVIRKDAKDRKRNLTASEVLRIERIEEDSLSKVKKLNEQSSRDIAKVQEDANKEKLDNLKSFVDSKKQTEELSLVDEVNIWRRAAMSFADGTKEKIAAQTEYKNALERINNEITSINTVYADKMKDINEDLRKQEEDLSKAYQDTLNGRINSLQSFAGLFDVFDARVKTSGTELLANLNGQVEGFKLWEAEIEKLSTKAIDEGLLAELREMGPKALPELLALNSLTEEQLLEYSRLFGEKSALARAQAEEELAGMKLDTAKRINELRIAANVKLDELRVEWTNKIKSVTQATSNEFKTLTQIGKDAGQNLLDGLAAMQPALVAQATAIAQAINAALQSTLGGSVSIPSTGANANSKSSRTSGAATSASGTNQYNFNFDTSSFADMQRAVELLKGLTQATRAN